MYEIAKHIIKVASFLDESLLEIMISQGREKKVVLMPCLEVLVSSAVIGKASLKRCGSQAKTYLYIL